MNSARVAAAAMPPNFIPTFNPCPTSPSLAGAYNAIEAQAGEDELINAIGVPTVAPRSLVASDSIILSLPKSEQGAWFLLRRCMSLSTELLVRGFLVRGAIVLGSLYHEGNTVFGEALTRAYRLESEVARYPRVLVANDVYDDLLSVGSIRPGPWQDLFLHDWLRSDDDGWRRLNPFCYGIRTSDETLNEFMRRASAPIVLGLAGHKPESSEFTKNYWFAGKYNEERDRYVNAGLLNADQCQHIDPREFIRPGQR